MDENAISVQCVIHGCFARVIGAERCKAHGGQPTYEWTDSPFGEVEYVFNKERGYETTAA